MISLMSKKMIWHSVMSQNRGIVDFHLAFKFVSKLNDRSSVSLHLH